MDNIDKDLVEKVEGLMKISFGDDPKSILNLYEFFKQLIQESDYLLDELDDIEEVIILQHNITDKDFTYWIKLGQGEYDYGEGDRSDKTTGLACNWDTLRLMMAGKIGGTRAYRNGELVIFGDMMDSMSYGAFMASIIEVITELQGMKGK